jgi:D-alanyl-D-alanine carboxypeptidase
VREAAGRLGFRSRIDRRLGCALCALVVAVISAQASVPPPVVRLQTCLDETRAEYGFPGATAAIVLGDGILVTAATGFADVEAGVPMTPASRMLAASIGKTFVGATVLALAAERRLMLDAPIAQYLSDHAWFSRLPNAPAITVRQLLDHTSGLPDHVFDPAFAAALRERWASPGPPLSVEERIAFVLDKAPLFDAGRGWSYSDTGFLLLGMIIETVTGQPWTREVQRRFLEPLGLVSTTPSDDRALPGLAVGYVGDNPFGFPRRTRSAAGVMYWHPGIEGAGGGFATTSADLARWGDALFDGRALPDPYLTDLLQSVAMDPAHPAQRYGAGVSITQSGPFGPVYGHAGLIPGYASSLRHYPALGATITFQINTDIGIADHASDLVPELEARLARLVANLSCETER